MIKFCPICGAKHIGGRFCFSCGADLNQFLNAQNNEKVEENVNETPIKEERIDGDITSISSSLDSLIEKEESKIKEYEKNVIKARAYSIRERYEEARDIYENFIEEDPSDMNGYMGVIRVVSKNYTEYEGKEIEEAINVAKLISREENLEIFDQDYAKYRLDREQYIINKEKERQLKIEQERLEKIRKEEEARRLKEIEEERIRKEEEERVRKEQEEKLKKEIEYYIDAIERHINEVEIEYLENFKKDLYTSKTINELKDLVKKHMDNIDVIAKEKEEKLEKERQALENEKRQMKSFDYIVNGDGSFSIKKCIDPNIVELANMKNVKYIEKGAFSGLQNLVKVVLPEGVKTIEQDMFANCPKLKEVIIPSSVTTIESRAFNNCASLEEIVIPNSVKKIGDSLFFGCSKLTKLTIPFIGIENKEDNENSYLGYLFSPSKKDNKTVPLCLKEITITNSENINSKCFMNCTNLVTVNLLNNVKMIGANAFYGCAKLENLTLSSSIKDICSDAFNMTSIRNVNYLGDLSSWMKIYFANEFSTPVNFVTKILIDGKEIVDLVVPEDVKEINPFIFHQFQSIKTVYIPNSVEVINCAFKYCNSIEKMTIPFVGSVKNNSNYSYFGNIFGLEKKFIRSITPTLKEINVIGDGTLFESCFENVENVEKIVLNDSIKEIQKNVFKGCNKLKELIIPFIGNGKESLNLGYFFNGNNNVSKSLETVYVTNDDKIGDNAYGNISSLKNIKYTREVKSIGKNAFINSTIEKFDFGSSLENIESSAFENCVNLKEIKLPDTINNIGERAFINCKLLDKIVLPNNLKNISNECFKDCINIKEIVFNDKLISIGKESFVNTQIKELTLPMNLEEIDYKAFYNCIELEKVTLNKNIKIVIQRVFDNCKKLNTINYLGTLENWLKIDFKASITSCTKNIYINNSEIIDLIIPEGTIEIKDNAFNNFKSIKSVTLPSSIKMIGLDAFLGCDNIKKVNYLGDISSWCRIVFKNNLSNPSIYSFNIYFNNILLEEIVIPNNIKKINAFAFINNIKVKSILIPESVKFIDTNVFYGCDNVEKITTPFVGYDENEAFGYLGYFFGANNVNNHYCQVPQSLKEVVVTNSNVIHTKAFCQCSFIEKVVLLKTHHIDKYAFQNCCNLKEIKLNSGLVSIDSYAFLSCSSIEELIIPDTVSSFSLGALTSLSSLRKLTIPFIGDNKVNRKSNFLGYIFGCTGYYSNDSYVPKTLKEVIITAEDTIASNAFYSCKNIMILRLPKTLKVIEDNALANMTSLLEIYNDSDIKLSFNDTNCTSYGKALYNARILYDKNGNVSYKQNDEVKLIRDIKDYLFIHSKKDGYVLFRYLGNNTKIELPKNVNGSSYNIGDHSFIDIKLEEVIIPEGVKKIGTSAFYGCNISKLTLPKSLEFISNQAFSCNKFSSVYLSDNIVEIGNSAFSKTKLYWIILPSKLKKIDNCTFEDTLLNGKITIPSSVETIGSGAFKNCQYITEVDILGNNLKKIGIGAFKNCVKLLQINLPESLVELEIPISKFEIEYYGGCFEGCHRLYSIDIPKNITKLGGLFNNCSCLSMVKLPENLKELSGSMFTYCTSLNCLTIPKSVKKLSSELFFNNSSLKELTLLNPNIELCAAYSLDLDTVYIPKETNLITLAKLVSKMKQAFGKDVKVKQLKD